MEGCIHCYKLSNGTLTVIRYWDKILGSIMRPCVGAMSSGLHLTMLGFMWQKYARFWRMKEPIPSTGSNAHLTLPPIKQQKLPLYSNQMNVCVHLLQ